MSYAAVTAKNAHQSPEEARAQPVPELQPSETSTSSLVDVDSPHVSSVPSNYESQEIKTSTQADRREREKAEAAETRKRAEDKAKQLRAKADRAGSHLRRNSDNPVVLGNAVLSACLFGALGYGAYVKYRAGEFTWKVVGIGAAVLGAFGVVDYYATQFLFKKYPPKK